MAERHRLTTARLTLLAAAGELLEAEGRGRKALGEALGATISPEWPPAVRSPESVSQALARARADESASGWTSWYLVADDAATGSSGGVGVEPHGESAGGATGSAETSPAGSAVLASSRSSATEPPSAHSTTIPASVDAPPDSREPLPQFAPGGTAASPGGPVLVGLAGFAGRPSTAGEVAIDILILPAFRRRGLAAEALAALLDWAFVHRTVKEVKAQVDSSAPGGAGLLGRLGFAPTDASRYALSRSTHEAARLKKLAERVRRPNRGQTFGDESA